MATLQDGYDLLHRGTIALAEVEANGLRVDVPYIHKAIKKLERKINHFTKRLMDTPECKEWKKKYGPKMNIHSNEQLGDILYNELKFPIKFFTETGRPATNQVALEALEEEFEGYDTYNDSFLDLFFRIKKYEKAKGTYLEGTLKEEVGGFIHPSFGLHNVKSYRSSASGPNVQNFPIRNKEIGPMIRRLFIPRESNRHIVEIDFASIEVRIGACYHHDPSMLRYIKDPDSCMHYDAACDVCILPRERVSNELRQIAKSYVFSNTYGGYYPDSSRVLWESFNREKPKTTDGVPIMDHLASKGITELGLCDKKGSPVPGTYEHHIMKCEKILWEERFPVYDKWRKDTYAAYAKTGVFYNLMGFEYSGLFSRNDVTNYGPQGTAFQCLLWCLCELQDELKRRNMKSLIIGQVHDSLLSDVPTDEIELYTTLAHDIMTRRLLERFNFIIVPMEAEADVAPMGASWADKAAWDINLGDWKKKG